MKTVNAKGLDVREDAARLEALGEEAPARIGRGLNRGTCFATLTASREASPPAARVNTVLLDSLVEALSSYDGRVGLRAPSVGALLGVRGVVEIVEAEEDADAAAEIAAGI